MNDWLFQIPEQVKCGRLHAPHLPLVINAAPRFYLRRFAILIIAGMLIAAPSAGPAQTNQGKAVSTASNQSVDAILVAEFEHSKQVFKDFRVESPDEYLRIKQYHDQLLSQGTLTHQFQTRAGQSIRCIEISSQESVKRAGIDPKSIRLAPDILPGNAPPTTNKANNTDPAMFGMDGSTDDDGNLRSCPEGSIPILIPSLEDLCRFKKLEDQFHKFPPAGTNSVSDTLTNGISNGWKPPRPPDEQLPSGHEYAHGYAYVNHQGEQADFNVWAPAVEQADEFSLAQLWVVGGTGTGLQTAETGWQVYYQKYGDWAPHLFIFTTQNGYTPPNPGYYNVDFGTPFVQTDSSIVIAGSLSPVSSDGGAQYAVTLMFYHDPGSHNWWFKFGNTWVGYYPNTWFNSSGLANQSTEIDYGGEIINDSTAGVHTATDMGSGRFPAEGWQHSAYIKHIMYVDMANTYQNAILNRDVTGANYYDLALQTSTDTNWASYFYFGGPGRSVVANDSCGGAIALSSGTYYSQNTASATDDALPCAGTISKGIWFTFTPASTGVMTVDTCPSDFDTKIEVLSGACGSLASIVCDDDNGPACATTSASVNFNCTAGVTYHICAGGYDGDYGNMQIRATVVAAQPDLTKGTDNLGNLTVHPGDLMTPSITISNQSCSGTSGAAGAFHVGLYWSSIDSTFSGISPFADSPVVGCPGGGGVTINPNVTVNLATLPGTYYFGYQINDDNEVAECRSDNNGIYYWTLTVTSSLPSKAYSPSPANNAIALGISTSLSWINGGGASSYDVYFNGQFKGNQAATSYDPGLLNYNTSYTWRVDSKNQSGTTTGDSWIFTTKPQPPALSVGTGDLPQETIIAGHNAASQSFDVWNSGGGVMNFTINTNQPWMSVSPAGGSTTGTEHHSIQVNYNTTNLAAGALYTGILTVTALGADSSPQTVNLSILVNNPQAPKLGASTQNSKLILTWPTNVVGFNLQSSAAVGISAAWSDIASSVVGTNHVATNTLLGSHTYFRLIHP